MNDNTNEKKIIKSVISVSGVVVLSKIVGFIRQMIIANAFGATIQTDIISLSEGLVADADYLLVQSLSTAYVPIYINANREGQLSNNRYVSNTIKLFFILSTAISMLLFFGSTIIAKVLAPSYSEESTRLLSNYIRIIAPLLIVIVEQAIFNSLLKANERFVPGELMGFNQSIIIIVLAYIIGNRFGPDTLIIGFFASAVLNFGVLMVCSRKFWSIQRGNDYLDPNVKRLLKMMAPLLIGYSIVFVNQQVDKIIVSGFEAGTVTATNYAAILSNFITAFIGSICAVFFTYVAKQMSERKEKDAALMTSEYVKQMISLLIPISVLMIMNSTDIVRIIFGRGKFDSNAVKNCSTALIGYSCMFIPFTIRELYSRFLYSYEDSKQPMINSSISMGVNIVLSIFLSRFIGILGVTISTSISVAICGLLNYYCSKKKNEYVGFTGDTGELLRCGIGACICVIVSAFCRSLLKDVDPIFRLMAILIFSVPCYFFVVFPIIKPLLIQLFTALKNK